MPALRGFSRAVVERVFIEYGIHLLEQFPDGQTRWGNQPMTKPFKGKSAMAQSGHFGFGTLGDYNYFTIRSVIDRLGFTDKEKEIIARIEAADIEESEKEAQK